MGLVTDEFEQAKTTLWVEVLVDCPGATGLYTYRIPEDLAVQVGDIVSVLLGLSRLGRSQFVYAITPRGDIGFFYKAH